MIRELPLLSSGNRTKNISEDTMFTFNTYRRTRSRGNSRYCFTNKRLDPHWFAGLLCENLERFDEATSQHFPCTTKPSDMHVCQCQQSIPPSRKRRQDREDLANVSKCPFCRSSDCSSTPIELSNCCNFLAE